MILDAALNFFEEALNRYVQLDPDMPQRLQAFTGKIVAIDLTDLNIKFFLVFKSNKIAVRKGDFSVVDVTIKGSSLALLKMNMATRLQQVAYLFAGDITISGDIELSQAIQDVFAHMEIDWEEYLAMLTGDVVAHQIGNTVRHMQTWLQETNQAMQMNMTEYLQEEIRLMPPREAIDDFFNDIDQLRNDVERLTARIENLQLKKS